MEVFMSNYLDDNLNQSVFLDINYLDVLGENTFEYCLYTLLTHTLDLEEFESRYKNKKVGRKAYPPALLLRVIFYAYYRGITSSRSIERSCKTDLKFMALAAGKTPHFTTIADFVSSNTIEMKSLFHKVLMICCKSGLVGKKHFAIDGCRLPSDASKQWSGTHKDLKKKSDKLRRSAQTIIDRHFLNDGGADDDNKKEKQTVKTLLKNADNFDEFLNTHDKRIGSGKRQTEVQSNITDNESCKSTTSKGTIQGYNCQTASDERYQVVVATECFGIGADQSLLQPMVESIRENMGDHVFNKKVLLTADTGYSSEDNMKYLDLMKRKIDSEQGRKNYARRMWTIEPVFGNITSNKGINKLTLRGKAKVTCQWTICCIMHNIEKLWRYGDMPQYT
jgi:transposase